MWRGGLHWPRMGSSTVGRRVGWMFGISGELA
jgi:hypothetical protein